jgi:hypothetical protein
MRKRRQRLEARQQRASFDFSHQSATDPARPRTVVDDQGSHFRNLPTERRQIGASDYPPSIDRDDEARDTSRDFVMASRQ